MTFNDISTFINKIKMLESYDAVVEEIADPEPFIHPLVLAMRELREDGIVESVDPYTIFNQVKEIHREFRDIEEGDLPDRIYWFDEYKTSQIPLSQINLNEFEVDEDVVEDYIEYIKDSPKTMPPIVYDPVAGSVIDGMHRANAYARLGYDTIPAYIGLTKSSSYGEREEVDEEVAYHGSIDDITEFHPLTHFGTEKAAKDRMTYKKIKDGKIYKVDLAIKNPLTIKDFPGIHYDRLYAFELRRLKLISQEEMEAITSIDDKAGLRKALLTKLKELGIDGFVYKNRYEDKGNISYVIVDPGQVKVLSVEQATEELTEASPNTLEGSFTPDLVESKTWLCEKLAKGLKGKNVGTIYALGSWYGNIGIFLQQAGVKFDKLVLVEPDEEALMRSKKLLEPLNDDGKLILLHQNAEDVVFDKPGIIINTSCNETGPVFLTKVPKGMLCALQARNNVDDVLISTDDLQEFDELFPLEKTYYTGKKELIDPETDYTRFMKIGRAGNALSETASTGQGGGSAGNGGGQMVGGPTTYEQEYDMFKSKGPRRITAMTNEALDSSYPYEGDRINGRYHFKTEDGIQYKVHFQGKDLFEVAFSAILPGEEENFRPDKTTLTGTGNSRKVFGTVIKIVQDFVESHKPKALYFTAIGDEPSRIKLYDTLISQVDKALPDYYADQPIVLSSGKAYFLKRKEEQVTEALDSTPYKYDFDQVGHTYVATFMTVNNVEYETLIEILGPQINSPIEVIFNMINNEGDPSIGIENTGDARRVFATVIDIIKKYTSMNKPIEIEFSAKEPSRVRLYDAFIRRLDRELPKYELHTAQDKGNNAGKKYTLKLKTER